MTPDHDVAVFIEPISAHFRKDRLLEPHGIGGSYHEPYGLIRELLAPHGIPVHTADYLRRGEHVRGRNVYFSIANLSYYKELTDRDDVVLSALFHTEAPIIQPSVYSGTPEASTHFNRVFSFSTRSALAPFGCGDVSLERSLIPEHRTDVFEDLWSVRDRPGFLAIITQNKIPRRTDNELYSERLRAVEFFSRYDEIDLYGVGWDKLPFRVGEKRFRLPSRVVRTGRYLRERLPFLPLRENDELIRKTWKGAVDSKFDTLVRYTFALTYENQVLDGWINEKLFDAMLAGTVPIYLGAPDITDWVPPEAFIDARQFDGYTELRAFLHELRPADIQAYREAARGFLASEGFLPFRKETFAARFVASVAEDLGLELVDGREAA
jgi:alpha(1,3/1,4) fucosyltransferase